MSKQTSIYRQSLNALLVIAGAGLLIDCSSDSNSGTSETGGAAATTGGSTATGGAKASGGAATAGGSKSTGGAATAGTTGGSTSASGGVPATGGMTATGGIATSAGGASAQGGSKTGAGGSSASGGTAPSMGGITASGGTIATGGSASDGGVTEDAGYLEDGGEMATFSSIYAEILSARCTSCHTPGGVGVTVGKLDLSTKQLAYADLVGPSSMGMAAAGTQCAASSLLRVTPGDHITSLLWEKVNAKLTGTTAPCGNPMPAGGANAPLTQAQVDLIADWIDSGAHDN